MRLLLLAPPGGANGTQGERLAARFGVWHIAAGDLLRAEARTDSPAGRLLARAGQGGRSDDTADVIRHRLQVFDETTSPLVTYYQNRGILLAVGADQPPDSVTADIEARVSGLSVIRGA